MSDKPIDFDDVISPITRHQFLSEYWTKKFLHLSGAKGRFTPLLPWEELNDILQFHCPPQPQLRLFQEGVMVDVRRYIEGPVGQLRLNAGGLVSLLAQGASMVLDAVHQVAPPVAQLTDALGEALDCSCVANLYAGWRSQRAFDVHWDKQEVFVLQLSGRKRWQVFAPTRLHPLADDIDKAVPPDAQPIWDGILNDGDMLYLPRGFWHVAFPLDEPSLHISWGAEPPAGIEFVRWWTERLRTHPEIRQVLSMGSEAGRKAYAEQVVKLMSAEAAGDLLGEFLREQKASRHIRPRLRLPMAVPEQHKPLGSLATRIRLAAQDSLHIEHPAGEPMARFWAAGTYWFIRPEFIAAFRRLSGHESVPFHDLAAMIADKQLVGMLVSALDTLATNGVVFKEDAS